MYIKELTNSEFDNFANNFMQGSIYQTSAYSLIKNKEGYDSVLLGLVNEDKIIAATSILIKKNLGFKYGYVSRGFLIDYTNYELLKTFTLLIKKYLGKKDIIAIKISPMIIKSIYDKKGILLGNNQNYEMLTKNLKELDYYHFGYNNNFEALKPRFEAILDLSKPIYQIYKQFDRSLKNKINKSLREGITISKANKESLEYLFLQNKDSRKLNIKDYDNMYTNFEKNHKVEFYTAKLNTAYYLDSIKKQYDLQETYSTAINDIMLDPNLKNRDVYLSKKMRSDKLIENYKNKLVNATAYLRDDPTGVVIATVMVVKHRDTVYLYEQSYDKKYSHFSGKQLIIWSLIDKYSKEGYKYFNLGGVTNLNIENSKYKGLNLFKCEFNPTIYEYTGDYELITNQMLYFMYQKGAPLRNILSKK